MTLPNIGWVAGDEWRQVYAKQPVHKDIYVHRFIFYESNPDTHHLTTLLKQKYNYTSSFWWNKLIISV